MKDLVLQIITQGVVGILTAVIQILFGVLTVVAIKYMVHKFGLNATNTVVRSIEQQMSTENGEEKKAMAIDVLQKSFLGKFMSADQISHMIESAVFEMNQATAGALNNFQQAPVVTKGKQLKGDGLDG